jgi:hypothetical protein
MSWKSVVWASCLLPVLAGCGTVYNLTTETCLIHAQHGIKHKLRKDAQVAWQTVCGQNPRRSFTHEFHEGFLDGYVDYLDRGGSAQQPAAPPIKYVYAKRYFSPEGHCLVRDYCLGFKYGADVAVASGRREFLTVPVLPPASAVVEVPAHPATPVPSGTPSIPSAPPPRPVPGGKPNPPKKSDDPPPLDIRPPLQTSPGPGIPDNTGKLIPSRPKPTLPVIPPFSPDLTGGGKFAPLPPDPDLLPVPNPPLPNHLPVTPIPVPTDEPAIVIPPVLGPLTVPIPVPVMKVPLPASPGAVPTPPASVRIPSVLDDIPVIPFMPAVPAPIPVGNPSPRK